MLDRRHSHQTSGSSGASRRGLTLALSLVAALALGACDGDSDPVDPGGNGNGDGNGDGDGQAFIDLELVAQGLTAPVMLREVPDGSGRLFVADQAGLIRVIEADGTLRPEPFLDLRSSTVEPRENFDERGLLGLAFHPAYATNGRFYVYYSAPLRPEAPDGFDHTSHISEFHVSADPNTADPGSERLILQVDQPQFNHDAGTVEFGPDGYLYISRGDGGGGGDDDLGHVEDWYADNAGGNGQDVEQNLLGSILRIDVDGVAPYGIPADNPFVGSSGRDEIWAYGFRNPYRFSFDMGGSRAMIAGDAGQNLYEEVSVVTRGGNYGWNVKEGRHCFDAENPDVAPATCPSTGEFGEPLIDPVIEYANANNGGPGVVVVGGYVYRGEDVPELEGSYIFGDYSEAFDQPDGIVFRASMGGASWSFQEMRFGADQRRLGHYLLGFGQDLDGEIYILTTDRGHPSGTTGRVYRLVLKEAA